jgi:hypothetical protein
MNRTPRLPVSTKSEYPHLLVRRIKEVWDSAQLIHVEIVPAFTSQLSFVPVSNSHLDMLSLLPFQPHPGTQTPLILSLSLVRAVSLSWGLRILPLPSLCFLPHHTSLHHLEVASTSIHAGFITALPLRAGRLWRITIEHQLLRCPASVARPHRTHHQHRRTLHPRPD